MFSYTLLLVEERFYETGGNRFGHETTTPPPTGTEQIRSNVVVVVVVILVVVVVVVAALSQYRELHEARQPRGCTRTFGTDHYESISEDETGGIPSVGRLICDKIRGWVNNGLKTTKRRLEDEGSSLVPWYQLSR